MADQGTNVIPIGRGTSLTKDNQKIVELAFGFWLDRFGERNGSPKDDLLRAWQEVRDRTAVPGKRGARLLLVTKPQS